MSSFEISSIVYLSIAVFVSTCLAFFAWRNPPARGSRAFALTCVASIIWTLGDIWVLLFNSFAGQWVGTAIHFVGVVTIPVGAVIFVFQYFGREITSRQMALLFVIPAFSWLVMLTNHEHLLFFAKIEMGVPTLPKITYGPYFWYVHLPYCYLMLLTVFGVTLLEMIRATRHYRVQAALLFGSFLIPFVSNIIGVFEVFGSNFSYTALSFPIVFTVLAVGIFRFQFLRSTPIAYEKVFQNISDGVVILDKHDTIRDINTAAMRGIGKIAPDLIGLNVRDAFKSWPAAVAIYDNDPHKLGEIEVDLRGNRRYLLINSIPLSSSDEGEGRIITIQDITDRHQHQQSLEALAFHDPLTRVANRRKFQEDFEKALSAASNTGESLALLYIDLNGFKSINDVYGHAVGDQVLKYVAARAASVLRKPDIVGRLGGDEFAILLHGCEESGIEVVVERLLENVTMPFDVEGVTLVADLSIGSAVYPQDGKDLQELIRFADRAMYRAKSEGGGYIFASELAGDAPALEI